MTELERCLAFMTAFEDGLAERTVRFSAGAALFVDSLPLVWDLNFLRLERDTDEDAVAVAGQADVLQADLGHRRIVVNDEHAGSVLAPGFGGLGWKTERNVIMVHGGRIPSVGPGLAEEVSADDLEPLWERGIRSEEWGQDDEAVRQLVAGQHRRRLAVDVRYFAARAEGDLASYCELFSDGQTAQVETVLTLEQFRGRGLASAVVVRAVTEAVGAGHTLVFLVADADDWPKELYAKLGFEAVGTVYRFLRPPTSARQG